MYCLKSLDDLERARLPDRLGRLARRCVESAIAAGNRPELGQTYQPEHDGFVAYLTRGDDRRPLAELGIANRRVHELDYEAVQIDPDTGAFVCYYLRDNQCCMVLIVPDAVWLAPEVRRRLTGQADPQPEGGAP